MLNSNNLSAQGFAIVEAVLDGTVIAELARALETRISIGVGRAHGT
jgi:hypothetical protein